MRQIDAYLYETVLKRAAYYADTWGSKTALSAGIAALDMLTPEQREKAVAIAKGSISAEGSWELITKKEKDIISKSRSQVVVGQNYDEIKKGWKDETPPKPKKKSV